MIKLEIGYSILDLIPTDYKIISKDPRLISTKIGIESKFFILFQPKLTKIGRIPSRAKTLHQATGRDDDWGCWMGLDTCGEITNVASLNGMGQPNSCQ